MKARIGIGCVGALAIFALVYALLRLLDRKPKERADVYPLQSPVDEAPRLRRRDFHPDAPARRPISAARDLGEPDDEAPDQTDEPLWLSPAQPDDVPAAAPADCDDAAEPEQRVADGDEDIEFEPTATECTGAFESKDALPAASAAAAHRPAASITELMTRLEQGLARRQGTEPAVSVAADLPVQSAAPDLGDDRLQSAIDSLQRLAARQG